MKTGRNILENQDILKFRKARKEDLSAISELTHEENLLPRSVEELSSLLPYFHVIEDTIHGNVIACIGAKVYDTGDAEIISFRVKEPFLRIGIGTELLKKQLEFLKGKPDIERIFALTTKKVAIRFSEVNFVEVGIQLFESKVLLDCTKCPKNVIWGGKHLCNEVAMIYRHPPSLKG